MVKLLPETFPDSLEKNSEFLHGVSLYTRPSFPRGQWGDNKCKNSYLYILKYFRYMFEGLPDIRRSLLDRWTITGYNQMSAMLITNSTFDLGMYFFGPYPDNLCYFIMWMKNIIVGGFSHIFFAICWLRYFCVCCGFNIGRLHEEFWVKFVNLAVVINPMYYGALNIMQPGEPTFNFYFCSRQLPSLYPVKRFADRSVKIGQYIHNCKNNLFFFLGSLLVPINIFLHWACFFHISLQHMKSTEKEEDLLKDPLLLYLNHLNQIYQETTTVK